ncbi:MAG: hypothetical protein CVV44_10590 [Spirochaetae bacterium HGW-Spirochaetae-1]|nr:MAG: hypothetical protein CVV44_10590 [Spirochaetae bacterium HGW-Spirochaetae-1]
MNYTVLFKPITLFHEIIFLYAVCIITFILFVKRKYSVSTDKIDSFMAGIISIIVIFPVIYIAGFMSGSLGELMSSHRYFTIGSLVVQTVIFIISIFTGSMAYFSQGTHVAPIIPDTRKLLGLIVILVSMGIGLLFLIKYYVL